LPASSGGRRGALKARILAALRAAGEKGVAVKDLSAKLGVKNQNVHVWFSSTGKKLGTIQRVGAGRYRLKPGS
jgi:predicted transcriptional regulator of viral defense system